MAKATNKTQAGKLSVSKFLNAIDDQQRRKECKWLSKHMAQISGAKPVMWGSAIVGFGTYHYRYDSGRKGDFFITGFSPRKQALSVYLVNGFSALQKQLKKLGPHKVGKSCLYIKHLEDIDQAVLLEMIEHSVQAMRKKYPA